MRETIAALCAASLIACSSSTVIHSNVPARVFVDGSFVGMTPYTLSDSKVTGSTTSIRLEAPGYQTTQLELHRSEEVSVGAIIGGIFLLVPFLWVMGYKDDHSIELQPLVAQPTMPPPPVMYPPPGY